MSTIFLNKNKLHPKKHFTQSSRLQTSYAPNTKTIQKPPGTTDCMTHFLFLSRRFSVLIFCFNLLFSILTFFYTVVYCFYFNTICFLSYAATDNRMFFCRFLQSPTDISSNLLLCLTSPTEDLHPDGQSDHKQPSACRSGDAGQAS